MSATSSAPFWIAHGGMVRIPSKVPLIDINFAASRAGRRPSGKRSRALAGTPARQYLRAETQREAETMPARTATQDALHALFHPRAVAVIGASDDTTKHGY